MTVEAEVRTLPAMDVAGRLPRLRAALAAEHLEAALVTSLTNVRYLTGFTGSAGFVVLTPADTVLVTDGRYAIQSVAQLDAAGVDVTVETAPAPEQRRVGAGLVQSAGVRRVGLEAAHVSWAAQRSYAEEWFPGCELVPTVGLVEGLRRSKDEGELARIARAAAVADQAFARVRPLLREQPTEEAFARLLDHEMRLLGAAAPAFETIVAAGPDGARPHHRPTDRRIGPGEAVVVDFGAKVEGYCSDMTRTVWVDDLRDADLRRAVEVVTAAQAAGVAAVRAGVDARAVDGVCREVIAAAGWADRFVHGTGHGVGLDIHEAPSVGAASVDTLADGHVVTVEPGVYLPGVGGVRIEDTVAVTPDGCRPLTLTHKDHP